GRSGRPRALRTASAVALIPPAAALRRGKSTERTRLRKLGDPLRAVSAHVGQHLLGVLATEGGAAEGWRLAAQTQRRGDLAHFAQPRVLVADHSAARDRLWVGQRRGDVVDRA